jgi:hypothetical protein
MKRVRPIFFIVFSVCLLIALNAGWGAEKNLKNLRINKEVTAKIEAFDKEFFRGFDVYSAGVKDAPTALLFDIKDDYHIADPFWGKPLTEEDIIYCIQRVDDQYTQKIFRFPPQALNIVNLKGQVVGYVYTGLSSVLMDRKKDGSVIVYPPRLLPQYPMR